MTSDRIAPEYASEKVRGERNAGIEFTIPLRTPHRLDKPDLPAALVASSDEKVLKQMADVVLQCGLTAYLAFTADESKRILQRRPVSVVVCDDRLADGKYEDILGETARLQPRTPVIVVSATGDWPDLLKAIHAGAFDLLAYPPVREDFQRTIREALATHKEAVSGSEKRTEKRAAAPVGMMP